MIQARPDSCLHRFLIRKLFKEFSGLKSLATTHTGINKRNKVECDMI